jgi:hypothetical protein
MGIPGAWQYKFFPAGTTGAWPNDPLNHHQNPNDNNNTFLYTKDPTIYQILPNQREPLVTTSTPTISAYIFPKVGTSVDTAYIIHLNNVYTFARRAGGTMPSRDFRLIINDDVLPGKGQGTMAR